MSKVYRLTFDVDGEKISLRSAVKVAMRLSPLQIQYMREADDPDGFIELRDARENPLSRFLAPELTRRHLEYPTGDPAQPLGNVDVSTTRTAITILVPVDEAATSIALVAPNRFAVRSDGSRVDAASHDILVIDARYIKEIE